MLQEIEPDRLWHAQHPLRLGPLRIETRMTVVRMQDGGLWVHSPIAPTPSLVHAIRECGDVRHVLAPNRSHHLFFLPFLAEFPGAQGWVAPGLAGKRSDLAGFPELHDDVPWKHELRPFFMRGLPMLNETAWFHGESGTLVLTDLLFCIGASTSPLVRLAARALGVHERLAMSRTMKLTVRDRALLASSVAPLLALPVKRVIVAHDQVVDEDASAQLKAAFAWLRPNR